VSAGTGANDPSDSLHTLSVQLPRGKTCDLCTLQWIWSAEQDGGSYLGCADISITTNGQPVTPAPQPVPGEVLAGVTGEVYAAAPPPPPRALSPPAGGSLAPPPLPSTGDSLSLSTAGGAGIGASGGFVVGLLFGVAGAFGGLMFRKQWREKKALPPTKLDAALLVGASARAPPATAPTGPGPGGAPPPGAAPPVPGPPPPSSAASMSMVAVKPTQGEAKPAAPAVPPPADLPDLPAGWAVETDSGTGRKYYFHEETGESRWTKPPADKV
jgi:hypothetical protein